MATAEEILKQAAADGVVATETKSYLTIDLETRVISVPSDIKNLGVESDDEVKRLWFKMPRFYHDNDFSEFTFRINYTNANGDDDVYGIEGLNVGENELTFSWLVGRYALTAKGTVEFSLCLTITDENAVIDREFNTTTCLLPVLKGLEAAEAIKEDEKDIVQAIAKEAAKEALEEAGGKVVSFTNYKTMIDSLTTLPKETFNLGQTILIVTLDVPDLWICDITADFTKYTYTSDRAFVNDLMADGVAKVGHFVLSPLETSKVDLTGYVKNTDYADMGKPGIILLGDYEKGLRVLTDQNGDKILTIHPASTTAIKNRNYYTPITGYHLDYAVKESLSNCKLKEGDAWTDTEKANARTLLGIPGVLSKYVLTSAFSSRMKAVEDRITELETDMGDVDTALDSIIAIQNTLIGGETA